MRRALALILLVPLAAASLALAAASPARAAGPANWQLTFSGTGTAPGLGRLGFWGWCDFAGGTAFSPSGLAVAGTSGNCDYAVYIHGPVISGTCHENLDLSGWSIGANGDWFFSGTSTVTPAAQTAFCESFPGDPPAPAFDDLDSLLPAVPGHLNLNGLSSGGVTFTELQIQATPIP
jgi:hypothetical protein